MMFFHKGSLPVAGFKKFMDKGLSHFISTCDGGFSSGEYASMNLGRNTQDDPEMVNRNYQKLYQELNILPEKLILPNQTHGNRVAIINEKFSSFSRTEREEYLKSCDALITDQPGWLIGVLTADCAPILFFDPLQRVVAVAHAGWRGTADEIVVNVVRIMVETYKSNVQDIQVGIGPYISMVNYEVSENVINVFRAKLPPSEFELCYEIKNNRFYLDFGQVNVLLLKREGIPHNNIELSGICTYVSSQFYSYREQEGITGRFLSVIGL